MILNDEDKILIKSLYLEYIAKRLTDEFHEKRWRNRGVNKLLKKMLRGTCTVNRRPCSGKLRSARTKDKNSSGDEIANVNFYAVRPGSYPNSLK